MAPKSTGRPCCELHMLRRLSDVTIGSFEKLLQKTNTQKQDKKRKTSTENCTEIDNKKTTNTDKDKVQYYMDCMTFNY